MGIIALDPDCIGCCGSEDQKVWAQQVVGCPSKSRSVQLRWCIARDCSVRNLATIWVVWDRSPFDWTQCDVANIILDFSLWPGMRQAVCSEIGKFWFDWANDIWPVVVFPTKWLHCSLIRGLLENRYSCPIKSWNCTFRASNLWGPAHHSFLRSALAPLFCCFAYNIWGK